MLNVYLEDKKNRTEDTICMFVYVLVYVTNYVSFCTVQPANRAFV